MKQIIEILEKCDIKVVCSASDGDSAYNILNEETFEIFMKDAFHEGFDAAIVAWDSFNGDKHINDMLHCLKIALSRLLTGNISLNSEFIYHTLNSKSLESILLLGQPLTDDSQIRKKKDFYVLKLFNFENVHKLFEMNYIYEVVYLLPFTCWAEAVTNQKINRFVRIELLRIAFNFLYSFFIQNMFCFHAYGITYNNTKNSQPKVFADDNFLMRCMNSIIGLSSILKNYYVVGLDRIGTHALENFFGQVRYSCRDYDSWEHIMLSILNGTIKKRILCKYCINIPIAH